MFVPDATTATVPFNALADARGEYLIERLPVVVAPSAAVFVVTAERGRGAPRPASALIFSSSAPTADASPLDAAEAEAVRIAGVYRSATHIGDDDAQFDVLKTRGPDAQVIHFAGHGIGDDRGIDDAAIVLRQNGQERRVTVAEIAKLRLRDAVVVLAGCNTARGERRAAEGVISVAHGFLTAGATSVIATLWPIDDGAAARFFPRLHERLAEGLSPPEALRAVQLEAIRRGDIPTSLWAAVQSIGS